MNSTKRLGREKPCWAPKGREHTIRDVIHPKNHQKNSFCNMDWKRGLDRAAGIYICPRSSSKCLWTCVSFTAHVVSILSSLFLCELRHFSTQLSCWRSPTLKQDAWHLQEVGQGAFYRKSAGRKEKQFYLKKSRQNHVRFVFLGAVIKNTCKGTCPILFQREGDPSCIFVDSF